VASLSQGRTAAAQCGLFTHKSVPVIFEPPCTRKTSVPASQITGSLTTTKSNLLKLLRKMIGTFFVNQTKHEDTLRGKTKSSQLPLRF